MSYTKPELRKSILKRVMASSKGGKPGQWSARKAQLVANEYEEAGGGYSGPKKEPQRSLSKWTREKWRTKSGKPSTQGPEATGERYLPEKAIGALSDAEYQRTSAAKREGLRQGKQFVAQPRKIADKVRPYRSRKGAIKGARGRE